MDSDQVIDQETMSEILRGEADQAKRGHILLEAHDIINGCRLDSYGEPEDSFGTIAKFWSAYLDHEISKADVAMMMALLKVARAKHNANHFDSYIDGAAYIALAADMHNGEKD